MAGRIEARNRANRVGRALRVVGHRVHAVGACREPSGGTCRHAKGTVIRRQAGKDRAHSAPSTSPRGCYTPSTALLQEGVVEQVVAEAQITRRRRARHAQLRRVAIFERVSSST